jgi:hypothetical protein
MDMLFGILLLVVFGAVAWCAAAEGPWGAPILFFCVLFSGLLAMNFFEVTAPFLERLGRVVAIDMGRQVGGGRRSGTGSPSRSIRAKSSSRRRTASSTHFVSSERRMRRVRPSQLSV